jgi:eukaryotic-like serine/threonine-protein kinase
MPTPLRTSDPPRVGPYLLVGRLGEGGQGVVYLGRTPAGVEVAVKLLRADLADDRAARARFVKELAAAKRVAAAWTARVLDADVDSDRPYVVSEYVAGPSLQKLVSERGPLTGEQLRRLAVETLTALAGVHEAGVAHRDFKPANVLLGPAGPRVIDFGIARALDATATLTSSVVGTPAYMAPEQISPPEDSPVGPAADIWAWAATMVYAATGRTAFGADSVPVVMHRILFAEPDLTGFPDSPLRRVVTACLVKEPRQRPTAAAALGELTGGSPVTAPAPPEPAPTPARGLPRRTILAAATLGVAAAGTAAWFGLDALADRPGQGNSGKDDSGQDDSGKDGADGTPAKPAVARPYKGMRLPASNATVLSEFAGKVTLSSYSVPGTAHSVPYLWMPSVSQDGAFRRVSGTDPHLGLEVSPDGRWAAGYYESWGDPGLNDVTIYDRTGTEPEVFRIIRPPGEGTRLEGAKWSPDGRRLLIQVVRNGVQSILPLGFLLVNPSEGADGRFIGLPDRRPWAWLPDGTGIAVNSATASYDIPPDVAVFDLRAELRFQLPEAGRLPSLGYGAFDPAGVLLLTIPAADRVAVYGYHPTDQVNPLRVLFERPLPRPPDDDPFFTPNVGWYDADHLVMERVRENGTQVIVFTATSRYDDQWAEDEVVETLIEDPEGDVGFELSASAY